MNTIISTILDVIVTGPSFVIVGLERVREPLYARYLLRNPAASSEFVCPHCHHVMENDPEINFCEYCAHNLRAYKVIMPCCGYTSFPLLPASICIMCGAPREVSEQV